MLPPVSGISADGEITYRHIQPHEVRQVWSVVLDGVKAIRDTNGESWLPEDVYTALSTGKASLYLFNAQGGAYVGFGVFEVVFMPFEANPSLNVWLGFSVDKDKGKYGVEVAKRVAGEAGIGRVVFSTPQDNAWVNNPAFSKITTWYEVN